MHPAQELERVFPLSGGSAPRPTLRPPRLGAIAAASPESIMANRAYIRAWAARRALSAQLPAGRDRVAHPG